MAPIKPSLMTDFFASRTANMAVRCDDFQSNQVPKVPPVAAHAPNQQALHLFPAEGLIPVHHCMRHGYLWGSRLRYVIRHLLS